MQLRAVPALQRSDLYAAYLFAHSSHGESIAPRWQALGGGANAAATISAGGALPCVLTAMRAFDAVVVRTRIGAAWRLPTAGDVTEQLPLSYLGCSCAPAVRVSCRWQ